MTTIDIADPAPRTRGSAQLLDMWGSGALSGTGADDLPAWQQRLREHGGRPSAPQLSAAAAPVVGLVRRSAAGGVRV